MNLSRRMKFAIGLPRAFLIVISTLGILAGCTAAEQPTGPPATPDLTPLASRLTSSDANVQELALAPAVRASSGETPGVLPAGSSVVLAPVSWVVTNADEATNLYQASIEATETRPGEPAKEFSLLLVLVGEQWL